VTSAPTRRRSAITVRPFTQDLLGDAAVLLAERHRSQRVAEPLLPERFEQPEHALEQLEAAWSKDDASGAAAVRDGRLVGYVVGAPDDDAHWGGPNVWVEFAGHAIAEPDAVRDLYAVAAGRWHDEGRSRHYVVVPAHDTALSNAWWRLCFGLQQSYGAQETRATEWPGTVREAEPRDIETLVELAAELRRTHREAPVFSARKSEGGRDAAHRWVEESIASSDTALLVAEDGPRVVGGIEVVPTELLGSDVAGHYGLARPDGSCYLSVAVTSSESRGSGAGSALTSAALAWAADAGYRAIVTDWRVTNLEASRFWPRRGFRESFIRLYRSIP
jgi:ribosomal protein S18 acetylase RimI-like enzyme